MVTKRHWTVAGAAGLFILGLAIVFVLATVTGGVPRVVDTALVSIYCAVNVPIEWLATSLCLPSSLCPSYPVLQGRRGRRR